MAYDPNYKMRYRPDPISRLTKYKTLPPVMVDDPPEVAKATTWDERCHIVYAHLIAIKNGIIPQSRRRGLWFHAEHSQTSEKMGRAA